jgi:uncharacterized membrane protein
MSAADSSRLVARFGAIGLLILLVAIMAAAALGWGFLDPILAPLCHQQSDRCFSIEGNAMIVCSRCLGIYLGLMIGCLAHSFRPAFIACMGRLLVVALALNGGDALVEWLGVYENLRWLRLALGSVLGAAIAAFVFSRTGKSPEKRSFRGDSSRS